VAKGVGRAEVVEHHLAAGYKANAKERA